MGTATRVYISLALIATALIFAARGPVFWGLIAGGVLAYFLFPLVIQGLLAPLERRVLAASRRDATGLLQEVRARRLVRQFAPHAWLTLQEGRLHLRRGDGKAASRAFTETVRLSRGADAPGLISAQAHALLIADQPEQTRELLTQLSKQHPLSPTDHLHLGLALLAGKARGPEALEHVRAAETGLGAHPRMLAALALALHRNDEALPALAALQQAQDALGSEPDPYDEALVQRGTKLLRTVQKAQQKRERKPAEAQIPTQAPRIAVVAPVTPVGPETKVKSPRKAKKEERRTARRAAKAEKRVQVVEPVKSKKAGKSATKPVAAKAAAKVGAVTPVEAKSVEAKVATKPVEVKPVVAEARPVEAKSVVAEARPVEAKSVVAEAKPVEVKPVVAEAKPVEVKPVVAEAKPVEVKPVVAEAKPVETRSVVAEARPIIEVKPVVAESRPVETKPVVAEARPIIEVKPVVEVKPVAASMPVFPPVTPVVRPEVMRVPAPPTGAALFGSLAPGAPRSAVPVPAVPGLPRAPVATPVPKAMPGITPPIAGAAPLLRPPMVTSSSAAPWAGTAPPSLARHLPPPTGLPSRPEAMPLPRAPGAVVMPMAPSAAAPPVPQSLAQALPDTDDGWDDMLDALEADAPSSPR